MFTTKVMGWALVGAGAAILALSALLYLAEERVTNADERADLNKEAAESWEKKAEGSQKSAEKWQESHTDLVQKLAACSQARDAVEQAGAQAVEAARADALDATQALAALQRRMRAGVTPACEACANAPMCPTLQVEP